MNEAKEAAQAVLDNAEASQEEVDAAVKALNDAVQALVEKPAPTPDPEPVQKEALTKLVEEITGIDTSSYTEESVAALQAALQAAQAALADGNADQEAVDQALAALQAAKDGLKVKDNSGKDDPDKNDPGKNNPDKEEPGKNDPAADVPSNGTSGNDAQTSGKGDAGQKNPAVKTGDSTSGVHMEWMLLSLAMGCAGIYLKKKEKIR